MHSGTDILLALLLAHVLADFPLQTGRMVAGKHRFQAGAYLRHLAVHLGTSVAALWLFTDQPLLRADTALTLGVITVGHGALDVGKSLLVRARPGWNGAWLFLVDQLMHVLIVTGAALWLLPAVSPDWETLAHAWQSYRVALMADALVIAAVVFPTGYLIRFMLRPFSRNLDDGDDEQGLANAGLVIGWIERALLMLAFAQGALVAVGFIVGAKSLVRFPDFRQRAFAEYFLIGTLLSVGFAGIGGLLLRTFRALV